MNILLTALLGILLATASLAEGAQLAPPPPPSESEEGIAPELTELKALKARFSNARSQTDLPGMELLRADVHSLSGRYAYLLDAQLLEAQICAFLGDMDAADTLYLGVLTAEPTRIRDGWEWAAIHAEKNPERTIQILRHLLDLLPERRGYALALYEYLEKHDPTRVDTDFERLLQEETASIIVLALIDMVGSQNTDRSVAFAQRLHERHPDDIEVAFMLARRLRYANRYPDALNVLATLDESLRLRPDIGLLLADCLYMDQQIRPSIAQLIALQDRDDPDYPAFNHDRDIRLSSRPMMIQAWIDEQEIRESQKDAGNPIVRLIIDGKPVTLELHALNAPVTVANFLALAGDNFYDGTLFHNVQVGFISQGGVPPTETFPSYANPGYSIKDESDRPDARLHFKGSIAMARLTKDKLVGSQFYITHVPTHNLHGTDPVFGHVIEGMDVIHSMRGNEHIDSIDIMTPGDVDMHFDVRDSAGVTMPYIVWSSQQKIDAED